MDRNVARSPHAKAQFRQDSGFADREVARLERGEGYPGVVLFGAVLGMNFLPLSRRKAIYRLLNAGGRRNNMIALDQNPLALVFAYLFG